MFDFPVSIAISAVIDWRLIQLIQQRQGSLRHPTLAIICVVFWSVGSGQTAASLTIRDLTLLPQILFSRTLEAMPLNLYLEMFRIPRPTGAYILIYPTNSESVYGLAQGYQYNGISRSANQRDSQLITPQN